MKNYAGTLTLFDADDLVGTLMAATGADDFTARFMAELEIGTTTGDATFVNEPGIADFIFPELQTPVVQFTRTPGRSFVGESTLVFWDERIPLVR